jgi:AcrR family transcriptional regulator
MPRPKTHDDALRLKLLNRAGELLSAAGPKALSLRKLAAEAETSTTAVYSLFGGKPELVNGLCVEGFRRFRTRMAAVTRTGDAIEDMVRLGLAYRTTALADPQLYSIMFTGSVPGVTPNEETGRLSRAALMPLEDTIRAGVESGVLADVALELVTVSWWSFVHGLVSLELNGNLPAEFSSGDACETALRANANGWRR